MHEKKRTGGQGQQWVIDDMGKGHGNGGRSVGDLSEQACKSSQTKVNLPTGPWMNTKRTSGQASAVGC